MPTGMASGALRVDSAAVDDPQIELIGVRKEFGDSRHKVVAVEGADLTVGDGELFAILGPSGSGKTTVLRMIAGFEQPTAGTIQPRRRRRHRTARAPSRRQHRLPGVRAVPPHDRRPERRVRAEGARRGARRTPQPHRRRARHGPAQRSRHRASPTQLSGGQRQRVALARALVGRPRVLLLDEPLGALDLKLREQMQIELKEIQREVGITFIIVTHDQDEALTLCDRLAVFNEGRIEQVGKARDVYESPANRFVADFVGTSNVLDGAAAEALVGRPGTFVVRPERIAVFAPGTDPVPGVQTVDATVLEVIYAGPTTRIAATTAAGVTLTATVLTASTWLPPDLAPRHPNHVGVAGNGRFTQLSNEGVAMKAHRPTRSRARRVRRADRRRVRVPTSPSGSRRGPAEDGGR